MSPREEVKARYARVGKVVVNNYSHFPGIAGIAVPKYIVLEFPIFWEWCRPPSMKELERMDSHTSVNPWFSPSAISFRVAANLVLICTIDFLGSHFSPGNWTIAPLNSDPAGPDLPILVWPFWREIDDGNFGLNACSPCLRSSGWYRLPSLCIYASTCLYFCACISQLICA